MSFKPIASDSSYSKEARAFGTSWIGADLPGVERSCDSSYGGYRLETLPPSVLGDDDDPAFDYAKHMDTVSANAAAKVQKLIEQAETLGLRLPEHFIKLMSSEVAQNRILAYTANYFDLGKSISILPDGEGYVVRFLNDQQSCFFWYLHLNQNSEHCVLCTFALIGDEADDPVETMDALKQKVVRCSPSFEDFIRRFHIESEFHVLSNYFL